MRRDAAMDGEKLAVDERRERERVERAHTSFVHALRVLVQAWKMKLVCEEDGAATRAHIHDGR